MGIDRDVELITCRRCRRRAAQGKADTGRRRHASHHGPGGDRGTGAGQWTRVQLEGARTGKLQDCAALREEALVVGSVGYRSLGDDRRRWVVRGAVGDEAVRLGRQLEAVTSDHGVCTGGVGRGVTRLESDVQLKSHTTEVDVGTALGIRIKLATASRFGGHVISQRIGNHELGTAGERHGVRLAVAETRIEGRTGTYQSRGQAHPPVINGRCCHGGRTAGGIDCLLENIPTGIVQAQ
ncbi:hypothetical protein D3C87_1335980 [compost metagenome]